jgi:beta-lactamase class A
MGEMDVGHGRPIGRRWLVRGAGLGMLGLALLPRPAAAQPLATGRTLATRRAVLQATVRRRVGALSAAYGVLILDADGSVLFSHRADARFPAASLYKLGVAATVFARQRAGRLRFDERLPITAAALAETDPLYGPAALGGTLSVARAVEVMLTHSSNVAARLLLRRLGAPRVNVMTAALGLRETRLLSYPFAGDPDNGWTQTTPRDTARFFYLLQRGRVVDPAASRALLAILGRQRVRDRLPAQVPPGTRVMHKTGDLSSASHDAGIIAAPGGPIIVAALSRGPASARRTIGALGRAAYDAMR